MPENEDFTSSAGSAGDNRPAGSAREEAERLMAAALAAASGAARGFVRNASPLAGVADAAERLLAGGTGGHVATGSPECCVCPVCRALAAVRDPSPELALRLATGASDLASGLTGVLRSVSDLVSGVQAGPRGDRPGSGAAADRPRTAPDPDSVWRTATARQDTAGPAARIPEERTGDSPHPAVPDPWHSDVSDDPWRAAVVDDVWHAATTAPVPPAGQPASGDEPAPPDGD
ncbi:hypothetical protein GCM10023322_24510 [Rugosimonospora acidiphila]|uniref:Uncharacterized protein n=1 Tax=Rugosimonospora acidiphila TaxID=556531 RepID=A0ABP9RRS8_9ACTN